MDGPRLLQHPADFIATREYRVLIAVLVPLFWGDPVLGESARGNVTGVATSSFKLETVLNGTMPAAGSTDVFVVIHCPVDELNFNASEYGLSGLLNYTARFTMRLVGGVAVNIGAWGASPPCSALLPSRQAAGSPCHR